MAQVLVNFRIDEEVKKDMEQACREMGLSMSTAFTIFAKKVGREKRIPFKSPQIPPLRSDTGGAPQNGGEDKTIVIQNTPPMDKAGDSPAGPDEE